jgi:hypothetical protein
MGATRASTASTTSSTSAGSSPRTTRELSQARRAKPNSQPGVYANANDCEYEYFHELDTWYGALRAENDRLATWT